MAICISLSQLARRFEGLVRDREIVFGEVYNEYNSKFVYPKVFVRKFDRCVGTSDMDESFRKHEDQLVSLSFVALFLSLFFLQFIAISAGAHLPRS